MKKITDNQLALFALLADSLFGKKLPLPENVDLSAVWKEAHYQTVALLAFANVDSNSLENYFSAEIKEMVKNRISRNLNLMNNHHFVHEVMSSVGIPYTIIKGYSSSLYYPDSLLRSLGDVDFLVKKEDMLRATEAMEKAGVSKMVRHHICHDVLVGNGCRFEMHFEPAGIPNGRSGELIRSHLADTIETSSLRNTDYGEMVVPDLFHHGMIILLHIIHHMTGEGIGLRQICDWAVFINSLTDEQFEALFRKKLEACGMWHFAKILTAMCVKYLGCEEMAFASDVDDNIVESLMADILSGGNFGQKDTNRAHEAMLISSHGKDGIGNKSKLSQLFISADEIVYNKWPSAKKNKLLLPIGWVVYGSRYLARSIVGKRPKIEIRKTVEDAQHRIDLYKEFHLYEVD